MTTDKIIRAQEKAESEVAQALIQARKDGAKQYNRVLTDNLGKPTYMDDEDGRQTVYKHQSVSEAIQKANSETIAQNTKERGSEDE